RDREEGAATLVPFHDPPANEPTERLPDSCPADPEIQLQLLLCGKRVPRLEVPILDQLLDSVLDQDVQRNARAAPDDSSCGHLPSGGAKGPVVRKTGKMKQKPAPPARRSGKGLPPAWSSWRGPQAWARSDSPLRHASKRSGTRRPVCPEVTPNEGVAHVTPAHSSWT